MNSQKKWSIILDLLGIITNKKKAKKAQIMEKIKIDSGKFEQYFDFLLLEGFISNCNQDEWYYMITKNGEKLLKGLIDLKELS